MFSFKGEKQCQQYLPCQKILSRSFPSIARVKRELLKGLQLERAGVSPQAIRKLLLKLTDNLDAPKILKSHAGYSFNGDNLPSQSLYQIGENYEI